MRRLLFASLFFLICVSFTLLQTGFVSALGSPFTAINVPLFITFFAISVFDERYAFLLFGISATLVGLISSTYLFTPLIVGFLSLLLLSELHERFFTNRTYYSVLTLGILGLFVYSFLLTVTTNLIRLLTGSELFYVHVPPLMDTLVALAFFLALLTACYAITVLVSKRIRSYFIVSGRM